MYLQMDLKVLETHAPTAARAAGVPEDRILAGLLRLWHRCWSTNTDVVGRKELAGCFGPDRLDHLVEALLVDFLDEADGPGWRVRGADRYLRLRTARRAGAAKTNAARAQRRSSDAPATLKSDAPATQNHALITESPSTENTTTSTSSGSDAPATLQRRSSDTPAGGVFEAPTSEPSTWLADDFWAWAQAVRKASGWPQERGTPRGLSAWWSRILMTQPGGTEALRLAYRKFCADPFWRSKTPPCPFPGFLAQTERYLPTEGEMVAQLACSARGCSTVASVGWPADGVPLCYEHHALVMAWCDDRALQPWSDGDVVGGAKQWLEAQR